MKASALSALSALRFLLSPASAKATAGKALSYQRSAFRFPLCTLPLRALCVLCVEISASSSSPLRPSVPSVVMFLLQW